MLLITGEDAPLLDHLCGALGRRGLSHRRVDAAPAVAERGTLFQAAFEARATTVVVVGRVPRMGGDAPAPLDAALLDQALAATSAPGVRLLVLVSSARDDDPALRRVKQRGVPYVVVRPAPLFDVLPHDLSALRDETVQITPEVAEATAQAIPAQVLAEAVIDVIGGASPQGRVLDLSPSAETSFLELLLRAGARPRTAVGLRARLGRLLGARLTRMDGSAVYIEGLEHAPAARAA